MSFAKVLATVAVGFAAAKGLEKYKQMGGMAGLKDVLDSAGDSPAAENLGNLAEQFGVPGGAEKVKQMMGQWGAAGASAASAGEAGLASLMNAMRGGGQTGATQAASMMEAIFGETPIGQVMEAQAKLMLRAMIQAAKADGELDEAEKQAILDQLGDDVSAEEKAFVQEQLAAPMDIQGLVTEAGADLADQVYAMSLSAIRVDNPAEAQYLDQLATALGLSAERRAKIHAEMGLGGAA